MEENNQEDKPPKRKPRVRPSLSKSSLPQKVNKSSPSVENQIKLKGDKKIITENSAKKLPSLENKEKPEKEIKFSENDLKTAKYNLQRNFAIFFLIGVAVIYFSKGSYYGSLPVGVMIAYILFSWGNTKAKISKSVFADSLYYLGFLFTFVSLLIAITFGRTGGSDTLDFIIGQMGTALITTVFGMAARVMMTHFDPIETDLDEAMMDEMSLMASEIQNLSQTLTTSLNEQITLIKKISEASSDQMNSLNIAVERLNKLSKSEANLGGFSNQLSELSENLSKMVKETKDSMQQLSQFGYSVGFVTESMNKAGAIIEKTRASSKRLHELQVAMEKIVSSAATDQQSLTDAVAGIKSNIDQAKDEIARTQELSLDITNQMDTRFAEIIQMVRNK